MKITAHTLVKNEEKYLWFAVNSVIDYVDEAMIWDTGSTDQTKLIISQLKKRYPDKIKAKFLGDVDINEFTSVRQLMLNETKSDWMFIVDGDEIWWDEKIKQTTDIMRANPDLEMVVNQYLNVIGDLYHYQDRSVSKYKIGNNIGTFTIRAMNIKNITGLNVSKPHGQQGFFDGKGTLVQDRMPQKWQVVDGDSYLHMTHMQRSSSLVEDRKVLKRNIKYKYELGNAFPLDYYYPEVFFRNYPDIIPSVWGKVSGEYLVKAVALTPIKRLRRMIPSKSGY